MRWTMDIDIAVCISPIAYRRSSVYEGWPEVSWRAKWVRTRNGSRVDVVEAAASLLKALCMYRHSSAPLAPHPACFFVAQLHARIGVSHGRRRCQLAPVGSAPTQVSGVSGQREAACLLPPPSSDSITRGQTGSRTALLKRASTRERRSGRPTGLVRKVRHSYAICLRSAW